MKRKWVVLLCWQLLSLVYCGLASFTAWIVYEAGRNLPLLGMSTCYMMLVLTSVWKCDRQLSVSWLRFLAIATLTVLGDWTIVEAYNRTNMATAMLLANTAVIWVTPAAYVLFRRKPTWLQWIAIVLALGGVGIVWVADHGTGGSENWTGNGLALASGVFYGVMVALEEWLIHESTPIPSYIFRFSAPAFVEAGVLAAILERKAIRAFPWSWKMAGLIVAGGASLCVFDWGAPWVMQFSDATTMDISMLSANFFSLVVSMVAFGQRASWLYILGFVCVPAGIAMYAMTGPDRCGAAKGGGDELLSSPVGDGEGVAAEGGEDVLADERDRFVDGAELEAVSA